MPDDPRSAAEIEEDDRAMALYCASIDPDMPPPVLPLVPTARQAEELRREHARVQSLSQESAAIWRAANKHKRAAASKRYYDRRAALPDCFTDDDWQRALTAFDHACAYCGDSGVALAPEHFVPVSSPDCPGTIAANMLPACASCNSHKKDNDPRAWLAVRFGAERGVEIEVRLATYLHQCVERRRRADVVDNVP